MKDEDEGGMMNVESGMRNPVTAKALEHRLLSKSRLSA